MAVWNNGSKEVRRDDILTPWTLSFARPIRILDARIRSVTRAVAKLNLDTSAATNGSVSLDWHVLEPGDGCSIQIVYAGGTDEALTAKGVFIGQKAPKELRLSAEKAPSGKTIDFWMIAAMMCATTSAMVVTLVSNRKQRKARPRQRSDLVEEVGVLSLTVWGFLIWKFWVEFRKVVPFDF